MLLQCETYGYQYNVLIFKSQVIHITYSKEAKSESSIEIKNRSKIKMVDKCKYLGTALYSDVKHIHR